KSGFRDHLCVADDAPGFADKICSLLFDPGKRQRMADEARAQVEEHYDWPRVVHPMEEAMEQLLGA
ncbi:MAG: glycosyltransferase, partial [Candidatus Eremiobacteraeota bacterium]|nr:glycosyltransferase [Candidatus Eremiobacteraeota bacterium]